MKPQELLDLLEKIDERHIVPALAAPRPRRSFKLPLGLCACLCLLLGAALWLSGGRQPAVQPGDPTVQSPPAQTPDMSRVRAADLLAPVAPADGQMTEQALRCSLLPIAGRMAEYHEAAVSETGKVLLPGSLGKALEGVSDWYLPRGHEELRYLIHREPDGYTLWEFACFTVLDDQELAELEQAVAGGQSAWSELPWFSLDLDFSPYPYSLVLEQIYGVSSADELLCVTVSPANMDNTDEGKALQAEIGTFQITDAQSLARLYDILCAMTCLGGDNWALIGVSGGDGDGGLLDVVRQTRYLTIETAGEPIVTTLKYTACSDRFYEYGGVAYSALDADAAAALRRLFGID